MAPTEDEPENTSRRRSSRLRREVLPLTEEENATPKKKKMVKKVVKKRTASPSSRASTPKEKGKKKPLPKNQSDASSSSEGEERTRKRKGSPVSSSSTKADASGDEAAKKEKKKKKAPAHQVLTEKDDIPKLWDPSSVPEGSHSLRIASWNVAGLRALIKRTPDVLADLVQEHDIDILCLQETKLQSQHLDDPKLSIPKLEAEGYQSFFSCSVEKKGYSGTAVYVRNRWVGVPQEPADDSGDKDKDCSQQKQSTMDQFFGAKSKADGKSKLSNANSDVDEAARAPAASDEDEELPVTLRSVSYKMGLEKHDGEGRLVVLDFNAFTMCNVYVPNSGQKLERLSYRTDEWDKDFLHFMQSRQKEHPVLWLGDLNVAHTHLEVWNDGAKHLPKQAGVTPEERASFQAQLDAGFVDAFRRLHPSAAGHYSYWSARAGNRPVNKGLRLDYFVCDPVLFDPEVSAVLVRDSFMLDKQEGSDHCPVVLELEVRASPDPGKQP